MLEKQNVTASLELLYESPIETEIAHIMVVSIDGSKLQYSRRCKVCVFTC